MALTPANLNLGGSVNLSGGLHILFILSLIIGGFAIIFLLFVILRNTLSYNIPINIWTRIGSGAIFEQDKGKVLYNKETKRPEGLKFRRKKVIGEYPSSDFFHPNNRGRPILNAVIADNKASFFRIQALMPDSDDIKTKWTQEDLHGTFHVIGRNAEKFAITNWLAKYGAMAVGTALTLIVLIFMIVVFQQLVNLGHIFSSLVTTTANLAKSISGTGLK